MVALSGCATVTPVFKDGQALLPVIVARDAAPEERAAANELARVLGQMSGLDWPLRSESAAGGRGFYVGKTEAAGQRAVMKPATNLLAPEPGELSPDGFRIWQHQGKIFIAGVTPEATGFGVTWFLQHAGGVRWYAPGALGEVIPRRTEWTVPALKVTRAPAYMSREFYPLRTPDEAVWRQRNGLRGRLEFSHALSAVFPVDLLATHPGWAPLVAGQRYRPASAQDNNWQPDLALPGVAAYAGRAAAEALARDPTRASFSLAMNDTVRFDQGEATRTLVEPLRYFRGKPDYSPLVFTFMNRAAKTLGRTQPDRYLGCLAYFWCENPPAFPVNRQVVPYVTTDRTQYYDLAYRAADLELMSRWGASGVRAFGLWEYGYGQGFLIPRVAHRALAGSVREGWRRGARGYFADIAPQWGFDAFKCWMLAQLLWEPERSYDELAADFFPGYYGVAAGPMRNFFERCEAQWMQQGGEPYWLKFFQQEDQARLFPSAVCRELRALLDEAARVKNDATVSARVNQTSRAFAVTEAYVELDETRRRLMALEPENWKPRSEEEAPAACLIGSFQRAEVGLRAALKAAGRGKSPAMTQTELAFFVRDDPVPRLLWLAGQADPRAPRRLLVAAKIDPLGAGPWWLLSRSGIYAQLAGAPNLVFNGSFAAGSSQGLEPAFLHRSSGRLPAGWIVNAMPTENGRVTLAVAENLAPGHALRIEGGWDTQAYQWLPAEAGRSYVATAKLRGQSSPGNDAGLFLTFLSRTGAVVGTHRMQSLPKGLTAEWRQAVLADAAPLETVWVGVGVGASRQVTGDWLEAATVELRGIRGTVSP